MTTTVSRVDNCFITSSKNLSDDDDCSDQNEQKQSKSKSEKTATVAAAATTAELNYVKVEKGIKINCPLCSFS